MDVSAAKRLLNDDVIGAMMTDASEIFGCSKSLRSAQDKKFCDGVSCADVVQMISFKLKLLVIKFKNFCVRMKSEIADIEKYITF